MSQVEDCKLKTIGELPFNEVFKTHTIWSIWTILYGRYHFNHEIYERLKLSTWVMWELSFPQRKIIDVLRPK